jgi:hypothetical protein
MFEFHMLVVTVVMLNILELIMEIVPNYPTVSTRRCGPLLTHWPLWPWNTFTFFLPFTSTIQEDTAAWMLAMVVQCQAADTAGRRGIHTVTGWLRRIEFGMEKDPERGRHPFRSVHVYRTYVTWYKYIVASASRVRGGVLFHDHLFSPVKNRRGRNYVDWKVLVEHGPDAPGLTKLK